MSTPQYPLHNNVHLMKNSQVYKVELQGKIMAMALNTFTTMVRNKDPVK